MRFLFFIPICLICLATLAVAQDNVIELTNGDILMMVKDKVPPEVIVTRIQTSRCHFDTFPTVISELRYRGVAEEILVAMLEAPIGRPTKSVGSQTAQKSASEISSVAAPVESQSTAVKTETVPAGAKPEAASPKPSPITVKVESESAAPEPIAAADVLTNVDVIKLLHDGLATSRIADRIKNATGNYDFSPKAVLALQEAGADAAIFLSMMEVSRSATKVDNKNAVEVLYPVKLAKPD